MSSTTTFPHAPEAPDWFSPSSKAGSIPYITAYRASPLERIRVITHGVDAYVITTLADDMKMGKVRLARALGLSRSTANRKKHTAKPLDPKHGELVLGVIMLVGQVQQMINESGHTENFDAKQWVAQWLGQPLPALGGKAPEAFMGTVTGQQLVSSLLAQVQSGAYA